MKERDRERELDRGVQHVVYVLYTFKVLSICIRILYILKKE